MQWKTVAMNKANGEQGSVTVSIFNFNLLFMRTDEMLQVFFRIKKRTDACTLGVQKVQITSQNQVTPILPGGGGAKYAPLPFFLRHPETDQAETF